MFIILLIFARVDMNKQEEIQIDMLTLWDAIMALEKMGIVKASIIDTEFEWFIDQFDNNFYSHVEHSTLIMSHQRFRLTKYLGL